MFPVFLFALVRWRKFMSIFPFAGGVAIAGFIVVGGVYLLTPNWARRMVRRAALPAVCPAGAFATGCPAAR